MEVCVKWGFCCQRSKRVLDLRNYNKVDERIALVEIFLAIHTLKIRYFHCGANLMDAKCIFADIMLKICMVKVKWGEDNDTNF